MSDILIEQRFQTIQKAIKQRQFGYTQSLATQLMNDYPANPKVQRFLTQIADILEKHLVEEIDAKIKSLAPLWKAERYNELIEVYGGLYRLLPSHPKLEEDLKHLRELQAIKVGNRAENFVKESLAMIKGFYHQGEFREVIKSCNEFFKFDRSNKTIWSFYEKALTKFINAKVKVGEELMKYGNVREALSYFEQLYRLDQSNRVVKSHIVFLQKQLLRAELVHKSELILNRSNLVKELLKKSNFDEAIRVLQQILLLDRKRSWSRRLLRRIQKRVSQVIEREIVEQMNKAHRILRDEWKISREGMVKI